MIKVYYKDKEKNIQFFRANNHIEADQHIKYLIKCGHEVNDVERVPIKCRVCGCDDDHACKGGCYWVETDLCSQCSELGFKVEMEVFTQFMIDEGRFQTINKETKIIADELPGEDAAYYFTLGYVDALGNLESNDDLVIDQKVPHKLIRFNLIDNTNPNTYTSLEFIEV